MLGARIRLLLGIIWKGVLIELLILVVLTVIEYYTSAEHYQTLDESFQDALVIHLYFNIFLVVMPITLYFIIKEIINHYIKK
jgi:hypothetical protein